VRLTAVQMPITRESQTWDFFGFRSSRCGKSTSRVLVTWPLSVVVWMTSMYSTVQNSVYSVDYGHLNSWTWQGSLKLFRVRGLGLGIQLSGLALDS